MNIAFTNQQNYKEYLKYLAPSVISMVFLSFYTTIDGFFVSRYVGAEALAAINIIVPLTCVFFGLSVMLATGSGAIVSIRQGEGRHHEANQFYTFVVICLLIIIAILTVVFLVFLDPILRISGSTDALMPYTRPYGFWTVMMIPAMMLKLFFEYYSRTDGHPKVALAMSVSGLIANVILDWLFVAILGWGISGAGMATGLSMYISAAIGVGHFLSGRNNLKFVKPKIEIKQFFSACYNGISEMMTELSTGVTTLLFNLTLLKFAGENGVAAMSIITYFYYFFTAVYFGVTVAAQPVISYNLGARNQRKMKEIVKHSYITLAWTSIAIVGLSFIFAKPLVMIFSIDPAVTSIAIPGFKIFCIAFLLCGVNIFISGYFTAIGNGGLSAIVSFCRSLIFVVAYLFTLPQIFDIAGVWMTNPMAEITTAIIAVILYKIFNVHCDKNFKKLK